MPVNQSKIEQKHINLLLFGFTLAEVLITLGIIGIVAAMTIPSLINNAQNTQYISAWKKAFSEISQAYKMAVTDNGAGYGVYGVLCSSPGTCTGNAKFSAIQPYLKATKVCNGNTFGNCWATNGVKPDSSISGGTAFKLSGQNARLGFVTNDGMFLILYSDNYSMVAVDTNGNKGPNEWGKDALMLIIDDVTVTPVGTNDLTGNSVNFLMN